MHPLQTTFATAEGEEAWCEDLRCLIGAARFDEAEAVLSGALAELDTDLARLCQSTTAASVTISGWPELAERIELHEGDEPVTGLTLAIGNDGDLDFEKGRMLAPYMMLGLYTDEAWKWSEASRETLLAECASESPAWAGTDEDLEAFLDIAGLAPLNTALIHSKQRHFIREGGEAQAPLRYVEYIVGCWWRALRFHQAVAAAQAAHPLPGPVTIVSGMVDMRPDVVAVHLPARTSCREEAKPAAPATLTLANPRLHPLEGLSAKADEGRAEGEQVLAETAANPLSAVAPPLADVEPYQGAAFGEVDEPDEAGPVPESAEPSLELISRSMITRKPLEEEKLLTGADLRRRIAAEAANDAGVPARGGFFARLFGRA
jgi:hypothetical protein